MSCCWIIQYKGYYKGSAMPTIGKNKQKRTTQLCSNGPFTNSLFYILLKNMLQKCTLKKIQGLAFFFFLRGNRNNQYQFREFLGLVSMKGNYISYLTLVATLYYNFVACNS